MTTTERAEAEAEFSRLFSAVWLDEAPMEALADWIREILSDQTAICLLATHHCRSVPVCLSVERFYGSGGVVNCAVYCQFHYYRNERLFNLETITGSDFTNWLDVQIVSLSLDALKPYWSANRGLTHQ